MRVIKKGRTAARPNSRAPGLSTYPRARVLGYLPRGRRRASIGLWTSARVNARQARCHLRLEQYRERGYAPGRLRCGPGSKLYGGETSTIAIHTRVWSLVPTRARTHLRASPFPLVGEQASNGS